MKRMKWQFEYGIILFLISGFVELRAQIGSLPEYSMGSRPYAMGQSALLSFSDAVAVSMNPSSIGQAQRPMISFFYTRGPSSANNYSLGLIYPIPKDGFLGVSFFRFDIDFDERDEQGQIVGRASFQQSHLLLTYGNDFVKNLSIGASAKFVSQTLAGNRSGVKNIGIDLGVKYNPRFSSRFLRSMAFGISIDNLVKPATKLTATTRAYLPREVRLIVENRFRWGGGTFTAVGNLAGFKEIGSSGNDYRVHGGLEYAYKSLAIRSGYRNDFWALGLGFKIHSLIFNYVFSRYERSFSESQHAFSLSFEFGSLKSAYE